MKGKAPNISAAQAERLIRKAKAEAAEDAISLTMTLMLTVLLDKYNAEDYIQDVYNDWNKLAEEVRDGDVKLHELRNVLRKEYQIGI